MMSIANQLDPLGGGGLYLCCPFKIFLCSVISPSFRSGSDQVSQIIKLISKLDQSSFATLVWSIYNL